MHHHGTNAELARLRHTETLRETRRAHRLRVDEHELVEAEVAVPGVAARLASRLVPELKAGLAWPIPVRHSAKPRPRPVA